MCLFSNFSSFYEFHQFLSALAEPPLAVDLTTFNTNPDLVNVILVKTFTPDRFQLFFHYKTYAFNKRNGVYVSQLYVLFL